MNSALWMRGIVKITENDGRVVTYRRKKARKRLDSDVFTVCVEVTSYMEEGWITPDQWTALVEKEARQRAGKPI